MFGRIFTPVEKPGTHLFINYYSILAGSVHLRHYYGPLAVVGLVELDHVLEGEITDDVTVEDEEWLVVLCQDVPREGQRSRGA